MDFVGTIILIFILGLQTYLSSGGSSPDERRKKYEIDLAQPTSVPFDSSLALSGIVATTNLSQSIFRRLEIVEEQQGKQQRKIAMQEKEIGLLKQQVVEQQSIIEGQSDVISQQSQRIQTQSHKIDRHERQIEKLRAILREMGKEISDEELEAMANDSNT